MSADNVEHRLATTSCHGWLIYRTFAPRMLAVADNPRAYDPGWGSSRLEWGSGMECSRLIWMRIAIDVDWSRLVRIELSSGPKRLSIHPARAAYALVHDTTNGLNSPDDQTNPLVAQSSQPDRLLVDSTGSIPVESSCCQHVERGHCRAFLKGDGHFWKFNVRVSDLIDEIRHCRQNNVANDFDNFRFRQTGRSSSFQLVVAHIPAFFKKLLRQLQYGLAFGIIRMSFSGLNQLIWIQTRMLAGQ